MHTANGRAVYDIIRHNAEAEYMTFPGKHYAIYGRHLTAATTAAVSVVPQAPGRRIAPGKAKADCRNVLHVSILVTLTPGKTPSQHMAARKRHHGASFLVKQT